MLSSGLYIVDIFLVSDVNMIVWCVIDLLFGIFILFFNGFEILMICLFIILFIYLKYVFNCLYVCCNVSWLICCIMIFLNCLIKIICIFCLLFFLLFSIYWYNVLKFKLVIMFKG